MLLTTIKKYAANFALITLSSTSNNLLADLEALGEADLAEVSGQAFFDIDDHQQGTTDFTRVTLGATVETQLNIDELKLGEYHRWENGERCVDCTGSEPGLEGQPADIWIDNFSLGAIQRESGYGMDGQYYESNEVIPFYLKNPYIELAHRNNKLVGARIGFEESRGTLSGNIRSLTGNLPVKIKDTASALVDAPGRPFWVGLAGALLGRTPVESEAQLVTAPNPDQNGGYNYDTGGSPDPVRASWIGMPDGAEFTIGPIFLLGYIDFNTTNCNLFGIPTCFPLSSYQSVDIGERQRNDTYLPTRGLFASYQTESIDWKALNSQEIVRATSGAFLNIPAGGIELKLNEAFNGLPRQRTEFIDRGLGLF